MTPGLAAALFDIHRTAWALIAAAAEGDDQAVTVLLGPGWEDSPCGVSAWRLAREEAAEMRLLGDDDPAATAREVIARSVADEATGAGP